MTMLRVYLDQKDFSRIAKGCMGVPDCKEQAVISDFLQQLVETGRIRVYFSWAHLVEALRYQDDRLELLEPYCEVVDRLTHGYCILLPPELERRELELALARMFGFPSDLHGEQYAYGRCADAIGLEPLPDPGLKDQFRQDVLKNIEALPLRGKAKKRLRQKLRKEKDLRVLLRSLPETGLSRMAETLPSAPGFYSRQNVEEMLFGSPETQKERLAEFMNGALASEI